MAAASSDSDLIGGSLASDYEARSGPPPDYHENPAGQGPDVQQVGYGDAPVLPDQNVGRTAEQGEPTGFGKKKRPEASLTADGRVRSPLPQPPTLGQKVKGNRALGRVNSVLAAAGHYTFATFYRILGSVPYIYSLCVDAPKFWITALLGSDPELKKEKKLRKAAEAVQAQQSGKWAERKREVEERRKNPAVEQFKADMKVMREDTAELMGVPLAEGSSVIQHLGAVRKAAQRQDVQRKYDRRRGFTAEERDEWRAVRKEAREAAGRSDDQPGDSTRGLDGESGDDLTRVMTPPAVERTPLPTRPMVEREGGTSTGRPERPAGRETPGLRL